MLVTYKLVRLTDEDLLSLRYRPLKHEFVEPCNNKNKTLFQ